MKMKSFLWALGIAILSVNQLQGQSVKEYNDFVRQGIKLTTKELVYGQLDLTDTEEAAFDKVFDPYFEKRSAIAQERLPALVQYTLNAPVMSDEKLKEFNKYLMKTNRKLSRLNKKYYNKSRRVIPVKKATQLFLAEKYLRNQLEVELIEGIFRF